MSDWMRYRRLEPLRPARDLRRAIRAEVADPAWFLGRQWQLGEHQGEDASSPAIIRGRVSHQPITYEPTRPDLDPTIIPAEALVETEPGDWWTIGRRLRLGRVTAGPLAALQPPLTDAQRSALTFGSLPSPYEAFGSELDGKKVFESVFLAGHPLWNEVPKPPPDRWQPERLTYRATFAAGGAALSIADHDGGDVDWFSADGTTPVQTEADTIRKQEVLPSRLRYPGAPHPRWWQIEDHHVDISGFAPDRSHLGTILLLDTALAHSDDWFTFPVHPPARTSGQPSAGVVVTLHEVQVKDSFDQWWTLSVPPGPGDPLPPGTRPWSLFRTRGLDRSSLIVWPTVATPVTGEALDEIVLGVDEDANLLWAVELRADGFLLSPDAKSLQALAEITPTGTREFRYLPSSTLPPHWHPYRIESRDSDGQIARVFVQGLVADLMQPLAPPRAGPTSRLIGGPSSGGPSNGHLLRPLAVPSLGLHLERRWILARRTDGKPVLWIQRRQTPLNAPPVSNLRFDVFAEAPNETPP